jgi:hypothetical protein
LSAHVSSQQKWRIAAAIAPDEMWRRKRERDAFSTPSAAQWQSGFAVAIGIDHS